MFGTIIARINVLTAAAAVVFGGLLLLGAVRTRPAPETRIGFVNIFRVRSASKKEQAIMNKIKGEVDREEKAITDAKRLLEKRLREELPLYEEGSPEYRKLWVELQLKKQEVKLKIQSMAATLERETYREVEAFMTELSRKLEAYAAKHGYAAIFLYRPVPKVDNQKAFEAVHNQWVLHRDKALDLTDEVITMLNGEG